MNLEKSKFLFIDFDGVIVNSNKFKEQAIEESILNLFGENSNNRRAIDYFNEFAGIGRVKKLSIFFQKKDVSKILKIYNKNCANFLSQAVPTVGFEEFINFVKSEYPSIRINILSGGENDEIEYFLNKNKLRNLFDDVLASERSKFDHLYRKNVNINDVFIGDSKSDLYTALKVNIQFVLMEDFGSIKSFPERYNEKTLNFHRTKNFISLIQYLKNG